MFVRSTVRTLKLRRGGQGESGRSRQVSYTQSGFSRSSVGCEWIQLVKVGMLIQDEVRGVVAFVKSEAREGEG